MINNQVYSLFHLLTIFFILNGYKDGEEGGTLPMQYAYHVDLVSIGSYIRIAREKAKTFTVTIETAVNREVKSRA